MSNITPFSPKSGAIAAPAYLRAKASAVNAEVPVHASYPVMSIKGKVFTIVKGDRRQRLTRPDDADSPLTSIPVVVIRANTKARAYYASQYDGENSDGASPTCFSHDGMTPDDMSKQRQARSCALCPHAVWGSKDGTKGTACAPQTRLAITDPDMRADPMLLRVPPASRKSFTEVVSLSNEHGVPYNALAVKVVMDPESATPKLIFRPEGFLSEEAYAKVDELFESDAVKAIIGMPNGMRNKSATEVVPDEQFDKQFDKAVAPAVKASEAAWGGEVDDTPAKSAPAASEASDAGAWGAAAPDEEPAPAAKPKATRAAKAKPAAEPAPASDNLMADLDSMLTFSDD